jgi:hypothetical protein
MQTGLTPPFALGMNNGSWYAGSPDGVGKAWTTTNPSSLDPKTKLWDLNGAPYGKLADKGSVGGTSSQSSNPNAATFVAGHSNKDNSSDSPQMSTAPRNGGTRYAYSAGAKSSAGTTKAEVWSATQDGSGNQHWVKLTDENGNEITPPDGDNSLNRGQYGTFTFTNGSEYISMDPSKLTGVTGSSGYWTVTGDTATDIVTGQTMKAADLQAVVKAQNLHNWTQAQSTQAIKNRDNPQDSGTEDSPVFDPINY